MFAVTKWVEFDAGHRVPDHKSKCRNPHGHRYRLEATAEGELQHDGSSTGMVVDFGDLKAALQRVADQWDHAFLIWTGDTELSRLLLGHEWKVVMLTAVPTAENLAALAWSEVAAELSGPSSGLRLAEIRVWETPTSVATCRR